MRKAVAHLMDPYEMSERRACKAIGCCRMTIRYQRSQADDAALRQRMRAIIEVRRRSGYRRQHVLLNRESYLLNHNGGHRALDLWFERMVKARLRGEARLVRYIDDLMTL